MPAKYQEPTESELEMYRIRKEVEASGEDEAVALHRAIKAVDPQMKHAFTPEAAERILRGGSRKRSVDRKRKRPPSVQQIHDSLVEKGGIIPH